MENSEVMMNEVEATEIEAVETVEENSGNGILGKAILGLGVLAGVTALVLHKTKDKREAKKIEKLRKKGYVVYKPEEEAVEIVEADFEEVEAE